MPNTQSANALESYDYPTSVNAIEDSTRLDLPDLLPTELQGLMAVGMDAGPEKRGWTRAEDVRAKKEHTGSS